MQQQLIASKLAVLLSGLAAGALSAPLLRRGVRPLLRQVIKGGLVVQQEVARIASGAREELEDLTAEAKSELQAGLATRDPAQAHGHARNPGAARGQA